MWMKTFKIIHQLSCFVGHPVNEPTMYYNSLHARFLIGHWD